MWRDFIHAINRWYASLMFGSSLCRLSDERGSYRSLWFAYGCMLARKIMRTSYFWLTMETNCCQLFQRCSKCQMHWDLIHIPPSELHTLISPWPFSIWGIDIIGMILPKSSNGHEFILVSIHYFTKWVEAASYEKLTSTRVASFIRSHIIWSYGVPHKLISDRGAYFRAEVETLL